MLDFNRSLDENIKDAVNRAEMERSKFRFKETQIGGHALDMSASEYERSVRSINRQNAVKRTLNKVLDAIDR